jgi:flagellar biogenesis protein FliO
MIPVLLLLLHGDDAAMELSYFWAAVLLALTPVLILGGIGVWLARKMLKERREANAERGMRNAESQ